MCNKLLTLHPSLHKVMWNGHEKLETMLDCQHTERQRRCGCPRLVPDFIVGMLQMPDRAVMGNPVVREWKTTHPDFFQTGSQTGHDLWPANRPGIMGRLTVPYSRPGSRTNTNDTHSACHLCWLHFLGLLLGLQSGLLELCVWHGPRSIENLKAAPMVTKIAMTRNILKPVRIYSGKPTVKENEI